MIVKAHRFHGYGSLRYVYRNGKTVRGPLCSLKYVENSRRSKYRLSVVVNKKVNGSAVVRNRIRRRIYESARRLETKIIRPYDLVFTVFSDQIYKLPSDQIDLLVSGQFRDAGVI